jgi:hypothetical protein
METLLSWKSPYQITNLSGHRWNLRYDTLRKFMII